MDAMLARNVLASNGLARNGLARNGLTVRQGARVQGCKAARMQGNKKGLQSIFLMHRE